MLVLLGFVVGIIGGALLIITQFIFPESH